MDKNSNVGRPKKYATPEDLQEAIDSYFLKCDRNTKLFFTKDGTAIDVPDPIPYTIEGLCEVLDLDRSNVLCYEKDESHADFHHTVKRAKLKIQRNKVERGLMGTSNPAVSIFDLKNNHNYVDRQEQRNTNINVTIDSDDANL